MKKTLLAIAVVSLLSGGITYPESIGASVDPTLDRIEARLKRPGTAEYKKALFDLQAQADAGDARASLRMGHELLATKGPDNAEYASLYFERAETANLPGASAGRAESYLAQGLSLGANTSEGQAWLARAAEVFQELASNGDANALWNLGYMKTTGNGLPLDHATGVRMITEASRKGSAQASYWMASYLRDDRLSDGTDARRFYLEQAASQGHATAAIFLASEFGANAPAVATVPRPVAPVIPAPAPPPAPVQQAPEANFQASALAAVSAPAPTVTIYDPQDRQVELLQEELSRARADLRRAQQEIASLRAQVGPPPAVRAAEWNQLGLNAVMANDFETAIVNFRLAAAENYAPAISNLGLLHLNGTGVPKDARQAAALFERAANLGNVTAAENLGRSYQYGLGLQQSREWAIHWYRRAHELGSDHAQFALQTLQASR